MRGVGWLLPWVLGLSACSFSQPAAPIRDAAHHGGHTVHHPVRPAIDRVTVREGDNLFRIAFDHGLDYRQLAQWNGLADPDKIRVGDSLRLTPPPERAPDDTPLVVNPAPPTVKSAPPTNAVEDMTDAAPSGWVWPAKGRVVTAFGGRAGAKGIDIAGKPNSPVLAAAPGRVIYVGAGLRGYGKLVIVKHSNILLSAYGHNDRVLVAEGQTVRLGQPIAAMGNTDAERVKLHFEIREYGKPVDPMTYLSGTPD
ncbi:MAG: hypothetical protein COS39_00220 [Hydrogenophilales bacterium CG03_land_8_20_14_0_80_62_28]|nr:peptidoglycan DD-metalloendopeptidase family protein [Betaproteobacteria bacterium]OIO77702.1 MAG: hypothetical protein AUJ86_07675 [Hydrogenophilaceae bacterium CG1_02_62_390]PIV24681.1 MAG: hypothetical protein COS39_00220 [Hydrogenophilales bacterium CG03_land_8_20_14_0_80_62_28]PIW38545.1 MAG: hypothetical protein COW23_06320 [Hydrogenophilales bacterium CG15_BIG_FIL_POST_REV_8_21_14_020_62_31]PIW71296.1 MAG: hypothetical protein COW07_09200 [Hydrogenophilales bacterium CG12_big_fil_rev_